MKILIFLPSEINKKNLYSKYLKHYNLAIACDGGFRTAMTLGVLPDVLIGDMDSLPQKNYKQNHQIEIIRFSHDKDYTDSELAVKEAIKRGATKITIIGGLGKRVDHTLLNLKILTQIKIQAEIIDDDNLISFHRKGFTITGEIGEKISLIPVNIVIRGITSNGLKYPLTDKWFSEGKYSVSNELSEKKAKISFKGGSFLLIRVRE